MKKSLFKEILKKYDINVIEKHLISYFIDKNNLNYDNNKFITKYFLGFEFNNILDLRISELEISNIKKLENYLELLIPENDRKLNGAFFTPNYIVDFIIKEVAPQNNDKCVDFSCGCGAFLLGLVEYYQKQYNKSIKDIISQNIFGSDILDYNVTRSKLLLTILGLTFNENIENEDFNILNEDSLQFDWENEFDVVVGNPPYVKYQDLNVENRTFLSKNWKTINYGTFNLYFAFFELGFKTLSKNGRLGYITPNNYFTSLSGKSLRDFFIQNKYLTRILDFRDKKVFDAQTYTALTFANKKDNSYILFDKIQDNQNCDEFLIHANGSPNYIKNLKVEKWRLLKTKDQENIQKIESIGVPLKDIVSIVTGIATLKDEVFFIDSKNSTNNCYIKNTKNGVFLIEKEVTRPLFKISNFKNDIEIKDNTLRIITPYNFIENSALPICEDEFKEKYPNCYNYLCSEKETLKKRDKGKNSFSPFYLWGRSQGITRFGKKLLNPTFSKYPRFLNVEDEYSYFTNGYGIFFDKVKKKSNTLFEASTHPFSHEENKNELQKVLNSAVMDYYIKLTSVSIQGGYPCYQKNFIEKFSIPQFNKEELLEFKKLKLKNDINEFLAKKYHLKISSPNLLM